MIFLDTETCGLHGPIVLLQYAEDDGPIQMHSVWKSTVSETMRLIEHLVDSDIVGFNLSFDWFHICQMYTTLMLLPKDEYLEDIIDEYAIHEKEARMGPCLKPKGCLDLMLHARKGPYQSTMNRDDIVIKRVPTQLAWELAEELNKRIVLNDVYFAKKSDPKKRWQVDDIKDELGNDELELKNVVLKFAPSSALKALAADALKLQPKYLFGDIEPPESSRPEELGYAPFALALGIPGHWNGAWPDEGKIRVHIRHWSYNKFAREYASDDIKYTRDLYNYFGRPALNDYDSTLACMVGAVRWRGFAINTEKIETLKNKAQSTINHMAFNFNSPPVCQKYLKEVLSETEQLVLRVDGTITTKGPILEQIAKWKESAVCPACQGEGCAGCKDGLLETDKAHPAALRAKEILDARHAKKEIEIYDKLLQAGRMHADLNIIGTRSSRMSGAGGLNAQGIRRAKETRESFPLADGELVLCGGDFSGFEVNLADAVYKDPILHEELLSGKKIHGLFGMYLFPGESYEQICASKGRPGDQDHYSRSKNGVFALLYGGEVHTLVTRVGISKEAAEDAYRRWVAKYKVWGKARQEIFDRFCSIRQPGGIGSKVEWHEPDEYVESLFGFKRYFTLENQICRTLFQLAENPPQHWQQLRIKVRRRDREQTACGALRSALFAAAFAVQAANMRAAGNHVIQSSGGQMCKMLQERIWTLQPVGIHLWHVQPLNVHDELMCPALPEVIPEITRIKDNFIVEYKKHVPLLEIEWSENLTSWADK